MADFSRQVIDVLAMPASVSPFPWRPVEDLVGAPIPADYRNLIDHTGAIVIDDWFCLYGADLGNENGSIAQLINDRELAWNSFRRAGVELRESYFSSNARLIAFASIEGTYFYWHAIPEVHPEKWRVVVVDDDLVDWYELKMSATECIHGVIAGSISLPPFDDLFDGGEHRIAPIPAVTF